MIWKQRAEPVKKLKVLFLMEDLCFGGTQKQNLELARRLDRQILEPEILTLSGPTDLDNIPEKAGLKLVHLGKSRKVPAFFFARLGSMLKKLKPDILIPCTALPNIWGRLWGRFINIPVIVGTCRGGGAPVRQHERFLWRFCDHIVCNSQASILAMRQRGVPESRLSYIANGVDTSLFQPGIKNSGQEIILCVARLAADKDLGTLIRAFAILAKGRPQTHLRLVGEGPEEKNLKKLVLDLPAEIASRIEFCGACANPAAYYAEADIFALSSVREGQPNVILEAMSSGLPVCATETGGIPALLNQGHAGKLSPVRDEAALATNMALLLDNPQLRKEMGLRGREYVQANFSFEAMTCAHEKLFLSLWQDYEKKQETR